MEKIDDNFYMLSDEHLEKLREPTQEEYLLDLDFRISMVELGLGGI